jgi:hypothetical protein
MFSQVVKKNLRHSSYRVDNHTVIFFNAEEEILTLI